MGIVGGMPSSNYSKTRTMISWMQRVNVEGTLLIVGSQYV